MRKIAAYFSTLLIVSLILLSFGGLADTLVYADEVPDKCTGVYVGKEVSAEGTTIIARSEDQATGVYNKMFMVQPATDDSVGVIVDTGDGQNGFSVEIPKKTLKYTYLPDASDLGDGPYYACCMNESGVAVIGTVSAEAGDEYSKIDPIKAPGEGLRESILPGVIGCQASSAEDAVHILASYIDRYGSAEGNIVFFSDQKEAWIFEIYGGTTYAAMRLPDDKMAVFGNQFMLGWVDQDNKDDFYYSKNLFECIDKLKNPVRDKKGRYHLAKSIDPGPRDPDCNMRAWRGHQLFASSSTGDYSDDEFYSLLFKPEKKVSVTDVMQLFGDRYEGTEYDMSIPKNKDLRPIGTTRQSDVHIVQTFDDLPAETCQLQWLAMGNAEHSVFVPAFSGITDTYEKYKIDNTERYMVNDSYYYVCRSVGSIAETDRENLSQGVKDHNLTEEKEMLSEVIKELPDIQAAYAVSEEEGAKFVTNLAMEMAEEQYNKTRDLFKRLLFVQMYNMNDMDDSRYKAHLS